MVRRKFEDVLDFIQPSKYIVKSEEYSDNYKTPVLTAGISFILGYTNEIDGIYNASKENPIILFDDFTTATKWVDFKFKVKSSACKILVPKKNVNLKYIYYALNSLKFNVFQHKRHWISECSKCYYNDNESKNFDIVTALDSIINMIKIKKNELILLDELIKSRFIRLEVLV